MSATLSPVFVCQKCRKSICLLPEKDPKALSQSMSDSFFWVNNPANFPSPSSSKDGGVSVAGQNVTNFSQQLQVAQYLFDVASEKSSVDHPLCAECSDIVCKELEEEMKEAEQELESYKSYLCELERTKETDNGPTEEEFDEQIRQLEQEERELQAELQSVGEERARVALEREKLMKENEGLEILEQRYWSEFKDFQHELTKYLEERDSLKQRISVGTEEYNRLKRTNVYNDAFHIWHNGHFGTINGFRLGRTPSEPVTWDEINTAWGHAALLLHTMASKRDFLFTRFRIIPMGNFSKIERLDGSGSHELFGGSGGFFWQSRFDKGMTSFLYCLNEFGKHAERSDSEFKMPYQIEEDKIGGFSIKYQSSAEEKWTKALKYMLTNLKWLLAWVAKQPS